MSISKPASEIVLEVKNLTTRFLFDQGPVTVVDKLSFTLSKGKTLALVGESGCGKSITALSLLRILPTPPAMAPEGEIWYRGKNLISLSEKEMCKIRGDRIAMIFQDPMSALNPVYTIGDQLIEVVNCHLGLYGDEAKAAVISALKDVGISQAEERIYDYPHQLSGGMKQRVMIAMALACEPDILIADEPTTALDVTVQAQVLELIRNLQRKKGMALLLITHDMGVVAEMADEVMVMYATQCVEKADVYTLFDQMAHPYTQGLFQSLPGVHHEKGKLKAIKGIVPPIKAMPSGCHFHPRCPYAMARCKEGTVKTFSLDHCGHEVRCWLLDSSASNENKKCMLDKEKICLNNC